MWLEFVLFRSVPWKSASQKRSGAAGCAGDWASWDGNPSALRGRGGFEGIARSQVGAYKTDQTWYVGGHKYDLHVQTAQGIKKILRRSSRFKSYGHNFNKRQDSPASDKYGEKIGFSLDYKAENLRRLLKQYSSFEFNHQDLMPLTSLDLRKILKEAGFVVPIPVLPDI